MKQTKLKEHDEQLSGRMLSKYKAEVTKYKADVYSGKVQSPVYREEVVIKKEKFEIKHNEKKETEQLRLL